MLYFTGFSTGMSMADALHDSPNSWTFPCIRHKQRCEWREDCWLGFVVHTSRAPVSTMRSSLAVGAVYGATLLLNQTAELTSGIYMSSFLVTACMSFLILDEFTQTFSDSRSPI
jgi:hypothetical protein